MKPFGWISVVYMLDKDGNREGVFLKSRIQQSQIDAERCARDWREHMVPFLSEPDQFEFAAVQLFAGD